MIETMTYKPLNTNIRDIFTYLNRQYKNYGFDEVEDDLKTGYAILEDELYNATKALLLLKEKNKNNQKVCCTVNNYLKILAKENMKIS